MTTTTRTVRISIDTYNKSVQLMSEEKAKNTPISAAVTSSETSWLSYAIEKGLTAIKHDRKEDRVK